MSAVQVRPLQEQDQQAVLDIYNHYVAHSHCTFDIAPLSMAQRQPWFAQFAADTPHQCFVITHNQQVSGYACSMPFKVKPAYRSSVEVSIYCQPDENTKGMGSALYQLLFTVLARQPIHRAYAGIALPNTASVALHEKFGFRQVGCYKEVGYKFDRYWDVAWFEKPLPG